jgi:hypothetical protein
MGALMQNAYGKDWVSMNMARKVRESSHTSSSSSSSRFRRKL